MHQFYNNTGKTHSTMKSFVAILALVAVVSADVSHIVKNVNVDKDAVVLRFESDVQPEQFAHNYETSNGIYGQAVGQLKQVDKDQAALEVQGSSGYTAPDGQQIVIQYVANEFGYQPQGNHLPTPPPTQAIPEYILRSLEYIKAHPPQDDKYFKH